MLTVGHFSPKFTTFELVSVSLNIISKHLNLLSGNFLYYIITKYAGVEQVSLSTFASPSTHFL